MGMTMFKVECRYASGWEDAEWTIDHGRGPVPMRFTTKKKAQAEIDEFVKETKAAARSGDLDAPHRKSDYRIVEAR